MGIVSVVSRNSQTVVFSSAQLLALHTTPVTLVAAPPASSYNVPARVVYTYRFGTTPYVVPDFAGNIRYQGGTTVVMELFLDILTGTEDQANYENEGQGQPFTLSQALGKALRIGLDTANPTGGDGTLEVLTEYVTVTP